VTDGTNLDEAVDELYATPPEGFTAARNALVKALKAEGRRPDADAIAALRKPGRLVWALNQLALADDESLEPLLEAAEQVRDGGAEDFREAVADLREAVNAAATAAARRFDVPRTSDKADLAAALLAIVADEHAVLDLTAGHLDDVPAPDAFGFGAAMPAPSRPKPKPKPKSKSPAKAAEPAERPPDQLAIRRATKRQKEAAKQADAADRVLARAEKALAADAEALATADEELAAAKDAVTEAEAALAAAREALDRAEQASAQAIDAQERSAAAVGDAEATSEEAAAELEAATADLDALPPCGCWSPACWSPRS
jgi:hypothetical protein